MRSLFLAEKEILGEAQMSEAPKPVSDSWFTAYDRAATHDTPRRWIQGRGFKRAFRQGEDY